MPPWQSPIRLALASSLTLLVGCGAGLIPKQAEFVVTGCAVLPEGGPLEKGPWQVEQQPVMEPGPAGAWDSGDVLNPSVAESNGVLYNLYSGFDGHTWRTGLATSSDGVHWEKFSGNPVLSPLPNTWEGDYIAANGSLLYESRPTSSSAGEFLYWYQAGKPPRIGLAVSADGRIWQRHGPPVLEPGAPRSWDEAGVADPYVIRCEDMYYLYYLGQNARGMQRLGLARSRDGFHWQKNMENPILELGPPGSFGERGLGEPVVFRDSTAFHMIYAGRNRREERRLATAQSDDGVHWRRGSALELRGPNGAWRSRVVCDPAVWAGNGKLWLWFGGGDIASPDQNMHGRIGLATIDTRQFSQK